MFYTYIYQHSKEYDYYSLKCHFNLVFYDNQYSTWIKSDLLDNKKMLSWKKYL